MAGILLFECSLLQQQAADMTGTIRARRDPLTSIESKPPGIPRNPCPMVNEATEIYHSEIIHLSVDFVKTGALKLVPVMLSVALRIAPAILNAKSKHPYLHKIA